jgi:hypothetical protein
VAERCGDQEGAGRALLTMFEEINDGLELNEKTEISERESGCWEELNNPA